MNEITARAAVSQPSGEAYLRRKGHSLPAYRIFFCLCLLCLLRFSSRAGAQHQPFIGRNQYPQFRQLSGLSGDGYGLDPDGRSSLDGPTAFSTPVAYVLGHDQFRLAVASESFNSAPAFGIGVSNGKGLLAYGHTFGQFNLMASDVFKSHSLDQSYNLQAGIIPLHHERVGFSIGVQDILGLGGSAGQGLPTDRHSSQSVFAVTTYRIDTLRRPIFVSAGIGTRRFGKSFESASYQFLKPLRGWVEYDGFGFNEGILLTGHTGRGRKSLELNGNMGLIRGRYFIVGAGFGF